MDGWHPIIVICVACTSSFFDLTMWVIDLFDGDLVSTRESSQFILQKQFERANGSVLVVDNFGAVGIFQETVIAVICTKSLFVLIA